MSWVSRKTSRVRVTISFVFLLPFLWHASHHLGTGLAEGKGDLSTCRHRADCGRETDLVRTSP